MASTLSEHTLPAGWVVPHAKGTFTKAGFRQWMQQLAAAQATGLMPASVAFVPAPMAAFHLSLMQHQFPRRLLPAQAAAAPPSTNPPANPQPQQQHVVQPRPNATSQGQPGKRAAAAPGSLPARKRPIEEMRKLQRVLLKLLPASERFNPEGIHLSQITVGSIRSYLDNTLGDAPAVQWHQDTYYTYLKRLFTWATGRNDISTHAAAECVWLKPGHGWVLREDKLRALGVHWQAWEVPLKRDQVRHRNRELASSMPVPSAEAALVKVEAQPAPQQQQQQAGVQQQQQQQQEQPANLQHSLSLSPTAAAGAAAAADCAAGPAAVLQQDMQPAEQSLLKASAAQKQQGQLQPMQPASTAQVAAGPKAAAGPAKEEQPPPTKASTKRPADDDSTSSSSSSSTSSTLPAAKRRAVEAAAAASGSEAAVKKQRSGKAVDRIDPCVLAAARVMLSLRKASYL